MKLVVAEVKFTRHIHPPHATARDSCRTLFHTRINLEFPPICQSARFSWARKNLRLGKFRYLFRESTQDLILSMKSTLININT